MPGHPWTVKRIAMQYENGYGGGTAPTTPKGAHMGCDCDTCCNTCGHDTNCTSQLGAPSDPSDDYTA